MPVTELTAATFEDRVLAAPLPMIVDFWAPWCGPCRALSPVLEQLADEYAEHIAVTKVNVDENPDLAGRYQIISLPVVLVFRDGKVVKRIQGAKPKSVLVAELSELLEVPPVQPLGDR